MGSPVIFNGPYTKTLTRYLRQGGDTTAQDVDHIKNSANPNTTTFDANAGSLYTCPTVAEELYTKLAVGNNTLWKNLFDRPNLIGEIKADWHLAASWGTGNNATFDGGGSATDTITRSTAAGDVIDGVAAWVWTATTTNNYAVFSPIDIPQGLRGRFLKFTFDGYRFNGTSGNVAFRVKDTTNGTIISASTDTFDAYDDQTLFSAKKAYFIVEIPSDCAQIEIGVQNIAGAGSTYLEFNRISIFDFIDATSFGSYPSQWIYYTSAAALTDETDAIRFNTSLFAYMGEDLVTPTDNSGSARTDFVANFDLEVNAVAASAVDANNTELQFRSSSGSILMIGERMNAGGQGRAVVKGSFKIAKGDSFHLYENGDIDNNGGSVLYVLITARISSTPTAELKAGALENVFSAFITNNGTAAVSSENTSFIASVNRSAAGTVDIVWDTAHFTLPPNVIAIPEGTTGLDKSIKVGSVTASGCTVYTDNAGSLADQDFMLLVGRSDEDYRPSYRSVITPPVKKVTLTDVKAASTDGGTFTSGAWQTRVLNTSAGDTDITSLATNQFTLSIGRYWIKAKAPAYKVDAHKIKLRNITASTDTIIGSSAYSAAGDDQHTYSYLEGIITIKDVTVFEIQHRCQTTRATDGFGNASGFSSSEIFASVEIEKLL